MEIEVIFTKNIINEHRERFKKFLRKIGVSETGLQNIHILSLPPELGMGVENAIVIAIPRDVSRYSISKMLDRFKIKHISDYSNDLLIINTQDYLNYDID